MGRCPHEQQPVCCSRRRLASGLPRPGTEVLEVYSGRRLLPTLADVLALGTRARLAIGKWSESGKGRKLERALHMPVLYSDAQGHVESKVKNALAAFIGLHLEACRESPLSWELLAQHAPQARKMVRNGVNLQQAPTPVASSPRTPAVEPRAPQPQAPVPVCDTVAAMPSAAIMVPSGPSSQAPLAGPPGPAPPAPAPEPAAVDTDNVPLSLLVPLRGVPDQAGGASSASLDADRVLWERDDFYWGHNVPSKKRSCAWVHVLPLALAATGICRQQLNARAMRGAGLRNALTLDRRLCPRCTRELRDRLARGAARAGGPSSAQPGH